MKSKEYLEFTQQDKEKGFIELEINFIKSKYNSHVSNRYIGKDTLDEIINLHKQGNFDSMEIDEHTVKIIEITKISKRNKVIIGVEF